MQNKTKKESPESLLREGRIIEIPVNGWSMYPLFTPGRDTAVLTPFLESVSEEKRREDFPSRRDAKRGDVALFRRKNGMLVLHRICRAGENEIWFVGDNMPAIERGVGREQLIGLLTGFRRNGHLYDARDIRYRILSSVWLLLRPFRPAIHGIRRFLR